MPDREILNVAELFGDGISSELSESVHTVAEALPLNVQFHPVDLTLESRRNNADACYDNAVAAIQKHALAMKYPTVTETESPNKILRERCKFSVIHRPVASLPGVETRHQGKLDLHIIRIAVGGTYEDAGRRIGDEVAVSIRVIERRPAREAALYAFRLGRRLGCDVVSSSCSILALWNLGAWLCAGLVPGVSSRRRRGLLLQGARLLPVVRWATHGRDGGALGGSRDPGCCAGAAVGAVLAVSSAVCVCARSGCACCRASHPGAGSFWLLRTCCSASRQAASESGCGGVCAAI
jgi:hypothetical protein